MIVLIFICASVWLRVFHIHIHYGFSKIFCQFKEKRSQQQTVGGWSRYKKRENDDISLGGLKSDNCCSILANCFRNIQVKIEELFFMVQIKGEKQLEDLTNSVKFMFSKFDEYDKERLFLCLLKPKSWNIQLTKWRNIQDVTQY